MVVVVGAFALGDVTVIKMVGLGTAIAIAIDATLMRALIVPAALVIMRRANWWAPRWLSAFVDRIGVRDAAGPQFVP
jgi:RND superfamily putative drug exporter